MNVRLLPKHEIDSKRAEEQRQRIQEGMRIAERVDTLRETAASEEIAFEKFRTELMQTIQGEIAVKKLERDSLEAALIPMRIEFERISNPPDLTQAWENVRIQKEKNKEENDRLFNLGTHLERENASIEERKQNVSEREDAVEISKRDAEIRRAEARQMKDEAVIILDRTRNDAAIVTLEAEFKHTEATKRIAIAKEKERAVSIREKASREQGKDLAIREARLKDRIAMFERTLKRK